MRGWYLVPAAAAVLVGSAAPAPVESPESLADRPTVVVYSAPVPGRVLRGFDPPTSVYGPGHRGVDLAAALGSPVRAAADGRVSFAGPVAGRGVVVLAHRDGMTTEYEPVRPLLSRGTAVRRGEVIAMVDGRHAGCTDRCLHWGARRGAHYLDPMSLLRPLGPVVLLPWSGDG